MNIRSGIKTGLAAVAIASAPLTGAAQKTAKAVANDSIKTAHTLVNDTVKKEQKLTQGVSLKVGVDYSTQDILSLRTNDVRLKAQADAHAGYAYARPAIDVGPATYNLVVPIGLQVPTSKNTAIEFGTDILGIRGLRARQACLKHEVDKIVSGETKTAHAYDSEVYQNINLGARFKNDVVNASVRAEAGRFAPIEGGMLQTPPSYPLSDIEKSGVPIVNAQKNGYYGARADVEYSPIKKAKEFTINAQGAVYSNKKPEASVGVTYRFE